jgi:hypothetical protein
MLIRAVMISVRQPRAWHSFMLGLLLLFMGGRVAAVTPVVAWGGNGAGQANVPPELANVTAIAAGHLHSLALKADGTVAAWGANWSGQTAVPGGLTDVVAVAAGWLHSLALKGDGTVVGWGSDDNGETDIPSGLSNVVAIVAGGYYSLALRADGTVVSWGCQMAVPANLGKVVAITGSANRSLALKSDGTVVLWDHDSCSPTNVPPGVTNVVAIAAGDAHSMALKADGTVVVWGSYYDWALDAEVPLGVPAGLEKVVAIAAGDSHCLALKADGTVVAWGYDKDGQIDAPSGLGNVVALAGGSSHSLALVGTGPPMLTEAPLDQRAVPGDPALLRVCASGAWPLSYQWQLNGANLGGATNRWLFFRSLQGADFGNYSVVINNRFGTLTRNVLLTTSLVIDETPPTVVIEAPLANARVSNDWVTVSGTADDNVGVSRVWVAVSATPTEPPVAQLADGTTHWTLPEALLQPGTNWVRAWSEDARGNRSLTSQVPLVYVVNDRLSVQTVGDGTVTPDYSAGLLEIGVRYSVTATASNGHEFVCWLSVADGTTNLVSSTRLEFIMTSGLTLRAVFVDTNRPTVRVTNLAAGQQVSDTVFTVQGTAKDNVGVSHVWLRINGGAWRLAAGAEIWSAAVPLVPGRDVIEVCAEDGAGNRGATNSLSFSNVVSDALLVRTVGQGRCTPDYENTILQDGRAYSVTAKGTNGHTFVRWIVATNWADGISVYSNRLGFVMTPNLTLTAEFVDTNRPSLKVANLMANQRISNAVFAVQGTAKDNAGVSNVWYRLNGTDWTAAAGTSAWTAPAALLPGTNLFQAYAEDGVGNHSVTCSVKCVLVVPGTLTLLTNGWGGINCNGFTGAWLEVNRAYTVKAMPGPGQVFSNWSGTLSSASNPLRFVMPSNMLLQANFVPNPFLAVKGAYNGLFYPAENQAVTNSGYFTLKLTESGAFSGKLLLAGATLSFRGSFGLDGTSQVQVAAPDGRFLPMTLRLKFAEKALDGTVGDGAWLADLKSDLAVAATTLAGSYTWLADGASDASLIPMGEGAGTVKVGVNGSLQVKSTLADGAAFSQQTSLAMDGMWPLFASLYGGKGLFMGWMGLNTNGPALWIKPPVLTNLYYPDGFVATQAVVVARYVAPTNRQSVLGWTNGLVVIGGGNLPAPLTNHVLLTNNQVRVLPGGDISNLSLTLTTSTGSFKGRFVHPVTGQTNSFNGALVQDPLGIHPVGSGGWFLGTNQGGFIRLAPQN